MICVFHKRKKGNRKCKHTGPQLLQKTNGCFFSVLSCPIARKHRLEEEEQDAEKPPSKRKTHPLKLALDEGFSADSDASSEADADGEKDENGARGAAVKEGDNRDKATPTRDRQTYPETEEDAPTEDQETYQMEEAAATEEGDVSFWKQPSQLTGQSRC